MTVGQLKKILEAMDDSFDIQINVSDHAETIGLSDIFIDKDYSESLVFSVSLHDDIYFEYDKNMINN